MHIDNNMSARHIKTTQTHTVPWESITDYSFHIYKHCSTQKPTVMPLWTTEVQKGMFGLGNKQNKQDKQMHK